MKRKRLDEHVTDESKENAEINLVTASKQGIMEETFIITMDDDIGNPETYILTPQIIGDFRGFDDTIIIDEDGEKFRSQ